MKRLLQIVAFIVVVFLAAHPPLAGLACGMGTPTSGHRAPDCGMAMSHLGMDCQQLQQVSRTGCDPNCCREGLQPGVVRLAEGAKPKALRAELLATMPALAADEGAAFADSQPANPVASAPARYILFRVIRI
jgi:hypothetical protein